MTDKTRLSRRELLGAGLALPLGALAAPARAATESCAATPTQTSGPFYPVHQQVDVDVDLTRLAGHDDSATGEVIRVRGRVLDEACNPVVNALVDLWQADANGRYSHPADANPARRDPNFQGWGQAVTDAEGRYAFRTIKPAAYPLEFVDGRPDERMGYRTPHIHFRVSRRGYRELTTQMYFEGEPLNETDIVLKATPRQDWPRLVLKPTKSDVDGVPSFTFDLTLARS